MKCFYSKTKTAMWLKVAVLFLYESAQLLADVEWGCVLYLCCILLQILIWASFDNNWQTAMIKHCFWCSLIIAYCFPFTRALADASHYFLAWVYYCFIESVCKNVGRSDRVECSVSCSKWKLVLLCLTRCWNRFWYSLVEVLQLLCRLSGNRCFLIS